MGETLIQRRRGSEEVFRYVKPFQQGRKKLRYLTKKPPLTTFQQPREYVGGKRYSELLGVKGAETVM